VLRVRGGRIAYQRVALPLLGGRASLRSERADRVLMLDTSLGPLRFRGARVGCFVHDLIPLTHAELWGRRQRLLKRSAYAAVRRRRPVVFTSSTHNARVVADVLGLEARVVRFGCGQLTDTEADRHLKEGPLRASERDDAIVYVGALEGRKDIVTLLCAFERAAAQLGATRLVLAGRASPSLRGWLARWRATSPVASRVTWVGAAASARVLELVRRAKAVVYPSIAEGFGLPVLEALASGTPVVASDLAAIRSWSGDTCTYAPPGDVDAWADALVRASDGAYAPLEAGQELTADYRWSRFAEGLVANW
jgi:glycosyltransferase involved in cell wall biosynthesis